MFRALRAARAVVSNDSGAAHLAAALGLPTLAFFGPTDPARCGPLGPRVGLLRADRPDRLGSISTAAAHEAFRRLLGATDGGSAGP
jgi:ADP-heptose:LPS heptosyltransferase